MRIDPLSNLFPTAGPDALKVKDTVTATGNSAFSNILSDALNNAVQTDINSQDQSLALLTSTDTELHTAGIENTKAELALNLAIQVRNKVIEAYNEVMRMQV